MNTKWQFKSIEIFITCFWSVIILKQYRSNWSLFRIGATGMIEVMPLMSYATDLIEIWFFVHSLRLDFAFAHHPLFLTFSIRWDLWSLLLRIIVLVSWIVCLFELGTLSMNEYSIFWTLVDSNVIWRKWRALDHLRCTRSVVGNITSHTQTDTHGLWNGKAWEWAKALIIIPSINARNSACVEHTMHLPYFNR